MTFRKTAWFILMLALLLAACNTQPAPAPANATPAPTGVPRFEKTDCWFKEPLGRDVECGWLIVPEDHAKPNGNTIKLAVARFKSDASKPEPDPIVYLEGGPGGSPLRGYMKSPIFDLYFAPLLEKRDLIVFDQRGTGYSQPGLNCPEILQLTMDTLDQNLNAEQTDDLSNKALLQCHDRLVKEGVNLDAYDSAQNAADIESMRQAMGYDKINLYGTSYGTRLALTVLRDEPAGIRSVVIDSVYTPQGDLYSATLANGARAIEAIFTACKAEKACDESFPNLRQTFFNLKTQLDKEPARFAIQLESGEKKGMLLNGDGFVKLVFQALYDSSAIPLVPRLISDMASGNFDLAAVFEGAIVSEADRISDGMYYAVQCKEEVPFDKQADIDNSLKQNADYAALGSRHIIDVCHAYGVKPAGPIENQPVQSDVPTLVFSGEFDPITPPAWAEEAAKSLSKSFYFNVPRAGHGSSISVDCPRSIMLAFLDDPSQRPNDDCLAEQAKSSFTIPPKVSDYEMAPFTEPQMKLAGVAPNGWKKLGAGTYTPTGKVTDPVGLVQQAAQLPSDTLLNLLENQLKGADANITFEQVGTRSANSIDWKLYSAATSASGVDLALGERDGITYLVMMQSLSIDRKVLYEAVFLPAVDALKSQ